MKKSLSNNIKKDVKAGARFGLLVIGIGLAIDLVGWAFGEFDNDSGSSESNNKPTGSE